MITYHHNKFGHYYQSILTPAFMITQNIYLIIPFFSAVKFGLSREVPIKWRDRRVIQGLYRERDISILTNK